MRNLALVVGMGMVVPLVTLVPFSASVAGAAEAPVHTVGVAGPEETFPDFDPAITRYAVTTSEATGGELTVQATTSDPDGVVRINGQPAAGAETTVTGLETGDEISVLIDDSGGAAAYSLFYLPPDFPFLEATTLEPGIAEGMVGLTLSRWREPGDFEAVVDPNGVPVYARPSNGALDLKALDGGGYVVGRRSLEDGARYVTLDEQFRDVDSYKTVGITNTDLHDIQFLPNGNHVLIAYEPNAETGLTDAVIQEVNPAGEVVFQWSSAPYADESVFPGNDGLDYAHINSVQVMADGDLLASFRHFSAVFKIARTAHDGFEPGDVVWRLGGKSSDFTFVDDPYPGGPCAQHTAYEQPNGNITIYDNGSGNFPQPMCIDPGEPTPIARPLTRATEYSIDEATGTATLVWSWEPERAPGQPRYALFAGSTQRLDNGNTLTGWAAEPVSLATEVDADGEVVWELRDRSAVDGPPYFSTYRAAKFPAPDRIDPEVTVDAPPQGAVLEVGERVMVELTCTDKGGSTLRSCETTTDQSGELDTSTPGERTLEVEATDGAGNTTTVTRSYQVQSTPRPDAQIRNLRPRGPWSGVDVYGGRVGQTVHKKLPAPGRVAVAKVRVRNDGAEPYRVQMTGQPSGKGFRVTYLRGKDVVTRQVVDGSWQSRRLAPGKSFVLKLQVVRTRRAERGSARVFWVQGEPVGSQGDVDTVALKVRARR